MGMVIRMIHSKHFMKKVIHGVRDWYGLVNWFVKDEKKKTQNEDQAPEPPPFENVIMVTAMRTGCRFPAYFTAACLTTY